jgi:hypothetical protein
MLAMNNRHPSAGLVPAVHAFANAAQAVQDVGARDKPGQGGFVVV